MKEERVERSIAEAQRALAAAEHAQREADTARHAQNRWVAAIDAITASPGQATIGKHGRMLIARALAKELPEHARLTLRDPAPDWAKSVVMQGRAIAKRHKKAGAVEQQNSQKAFALNTAIARAAKSRQVLDDIVEGKCDAAAKNGILTLRYGTDEGTSRLEQIPLKDLEPSMLRVAQLNAQFQATARRVDELVDNLAAERAALAEAQPARAQEMLQQQEDTNAKVVRAFTPPPGWAPGIDR